MSLTGAENTMAKIFRSKADSERVLSKNRFAEKTARHTVSTVTGWLVWTRQRICFNNLFPSFLLPWFFVHLWMFFSWVDLQITCTDKSLQSELAISEGEGRTKSFLRAGCLVTRLWNFSA